MEIVQAQLWEVHLMSSYYDDDPRMPGTVPIDERLYLIAEDYDEALEKADPTIKALQEKYRKTCEAKEFEVKASVVSLENLYPGRDSSKDGRMGYHSTVNLKKINLSLEEDLKDYRLAVCIVKKKKKKTSI